MFKIIKDTIKSLNGLEITLYLGSILLIVVSFLLTKEKDLLSLFSSILGVTSLILLAKGNYLGHFVSIIFSIIYIIISYTFHYYGEMFIYLFLMIPLGVINIITWKANQSSSREVKIGKLTEKDYFIIPFSTIMIGTIFYFILKLFKTANLIISTISVMTSFSASFLSLKRSPYYALLFILNDVVLIIMWILASIENIMYLPNVICFLIFLINDIYALINWKSLEKKQAA